MHACVPCIIYIFLSFSSIIFAGRQYIFSKNIYIVHLTCCCLSRMTLVFHDDAELHEFWVGWMDEWMDEWMDGWMDGWMDEWMDGCVDG